MDADPVFVRGFSRSGGTVLVTILDVHPDLAMSYELYPHLLESPDGSPVDLSGLAGILAKGKDMKRAAKKVKLRGLRTFLLRCDRGGLSHRDVAELLGRHQDEGLDFSTTEGQMRFVEKCCVMKMTREGKWRWGLKCSNRYEDYLSVWPEAHFLNVVRDGRDVLASQLNTGSFDKSPEEIGRGWANSVLNFRTFVERPDVKTREVFYEKLVTEPIDEVGRICEFLGIPFHTSMLDFHKKDLTIYRASSHLSMARISRPLDASRVGRWKREVSPEQLEGFFSAAREAMVAAGYVEESHAH